jgi:hypothetical protein
MTTETHPHVTTTPMLLDRFAPRYDFTASEHVVVDAPVDATYRAVRHLDLLTVHSWLTDATFWVRELPERVRGRVPPQRPTRMTLEDLDARGGMVLLGEDPGHEVAFGAIGRFWPPIGRWRQTNRTEFAEFGEPGLGKIAAAYSVRPYGADRTLLSYEARTVLDDPVSRRWFAYYWRTVSPLVRAGMRATLRAAKQAAESTAGSGAGSGAGDPADGTGS